MRLLRGGTHSSVVLGASDTSMEARPLLNGFRWAERGAEEFAIEYAQAELHASLPNDYLTVMRSHDGGEGWVGEGAYLRLWPIDELVPNNRALEARRLVPTAILFGTDGA